MAYFSLGQSTFGSTTEYWVNLEHSAFALQTHAGCVLIGKSKDLDAIKANIETLKHQLNEVAEAVAAEQRAK